MTRPVKVLPDLQTNKQILKVDNAGNTLFNVSGTLSNGHVSSSLPVTGTSGLFVVLETTTATPFTTLPIVTSSYQSYKVYDVNEAFHAIDNIISAGSANLNAYRRLRYQITGNFNATGSADIALPLTQNGGNAFPITSIDYVNVNIAIKENGSWFNDIASVNITSSGGQIHIIIDAPALDNTNQYRLIATNENPADYVI